MSSVFHLCPTHVTPPPFNLHTCPSYLTPVSHSHRWLTACLSSMPCLPWCCMDTTPTAIFRLPLPFCRFCLQVLSFNYEFKDPFLYLPSGLLLAAHPDPHPISPIFSWKSSLALVRRFYRCSVRWRSKATRRQIDWTWAEHRDAHSCPMCYLLMTQT